MPGEEENLQQQLQSLLQETYPEQGSKNEGIPMVRIPKTGTPKLKSPRACKVPKTLNPKPQSLRALGHAKYRRLEGFRIFEPGFGDFSSFGSRVPVEILGLRFRV